MRSGTTSLPVLGVTPPDTLAAVAATSRVVRSNPPVAMRAAIVATAAFACSTETPGLSRPTASSHQLSGWSSMLPCCGMACACIIIGTQISSALLVLDAVEPFRRHADDREGAPFTTSFDRRRSGRRRAAPATCDS